MPAPNTPPAWNPETQRYDQLVLSHDEAVLATVALRLIRRRESYYPGLTKEIYNRVSDLISRLITTPDGFRDVDTLLDSIEGDTSHTDEP